MGVDVSAMKDQNEPNELSSEMTSPPPDSQHDLDDLDAEMAALVALDAYSDDEIVLQAGADGPIDAAQLKGFRQVVSALAEVVAEEPPPDLRTRVLAAAHERRAPGVALSQPPLSPADAFLRTVEDLSVLLQGLSPDEWASPNLAAYGQTRDLIAHLVGVEESLLGILGHGIAPDPKLWVDHTRATASFVASMRTESPAHVADRWVHAARRLAALGANLPADMSVAVNDVPTSVRGMFVLRTFEVWTHLDDVCRATRRPLSTLDAARLSLMSSELVKVLPFALAARATGRPGKTVRIVLTGDGGGVFDQTMDFASPVGAPDAVVTASVLDFCRLASNRLTPRELPAVVEGDGELVGLVLAAAGAFARD
jgi:uncharacterized protein (TIGR03083 family)